MCGVWGMIAGQAVQGIMQYKQIKQETNAKVAMYRQQEQAAEQNAKISELRQDQIADKYANDQRKLDDRMRLMAGQTAAQAGSSNMTLTGSPLDILISSYGTYQDDSSQLLQNQRNDERSELFNQYNYENQAEGYKASAENAKAQGKLAGIATLLSTASSMYGIKHEYAGAKKPAAESSGADYTFDYKPDLLRWSRYANAQKGLFSSNPFGSKNFRG